MPKKDYYDDKLAPTPNSLVVAVAVVARNNNGHVLMIERTDNNLWAIPGGAQELGETTGQAAIRETYEETGIQIELTGIVGIYSDPAHVIAYDDGEVRQEFSIVFHARPTGGTLRDSSESHHVSWIPPEHLDTLNIHHSILLRIQHALEHRQQPYVN